MNNYDNKIDFHLKTQNASYESFIAAWDVAHHVISMTKRAPASKAVIISCSHFENSFLWYCKSSCACANHDVYELWAGLVKLRDEII